MEQMSATPAESPAKVLVNSSKMRLKIAQIEKHIQADECRVELFAVGSHIHKAISIKEIIVRKHAKRLLFDEASVSVTSDGEPRLDIKLAFAAETG